MRDLSPKFLSIFFSFLLLSGGSVRPGVAFLFSAQGENSQPLPIEIETEHGITCERDRAVCVAQGPVRVRRGTLFLTADQLKAHFHKGPEGSQGSQIKRLEAQGNVHIYSETEPHQAFGEHGIYQAENESVTLTGPGTVRLKSQDFSLQAQEKVTYRLGEKKAQAWGNVVAIQKDKLIKADQITAYLEEHPTPSGNKLRLQRLVAEGNVIISTPTHYGTGARGTYEEGNQTALLQGNASMSRSEGRMTGEVLSVNFSSGTSTIEKSASGPSPSSKRVRVVLLPHVNIKEKTGKAQTKERGLKPSK